MSNHQPKLICQTSNPNHEIGITTWKTKKKYEIQFSTNPMLKNEIKKIKLKKEQKQPKLIWVNMLNSQLRLWNEDNLVNKKNHKALFPTNTMLKVEIKEKKLNSWVMITP